MFGAVMEFDPTISFWDDLWPLKDGLSSHDLALFPKL
jgi:hypothetical protein